MNIYDERIRPLFDGSPLTNAELERKIGIKPKTINKWNSGYVKSYDKYIPQIASYFHVSTDYLLGNTDDPTPAGQKESSPQGEELPSTYYQLTPERRAQADSYLAFLLAEQQKEQT